MYMKQNATQKTIIKVPKTTSIILNQLWHKRKTRIKKKKT